MHRFTSIMREISRTTITVALTAIFVIAASVHAATTINTNIATDGTLAVTGLSTLTAGFVSQASSSVNSLTVRDYFQASSTAGVSGLATLYSGFHAGASSTVDGAFKATGILHASSSVAMTGTTTMAAGALVGGSGSRMNQILFGTCAVDLPSMVASTTGVATCSASGVSVTDAVWVTPASTTNHILFTGASSTAANTIQVSAYNVGTGGTINPDTTVWSWMAIR